MSGLGLCVGDRWELGVTGLAATRGGRQVAAQVAEWERHGDGPAPRALWRPDFRSRLNLPGRGNPAARYSRPETVRSSPSLSQREGLTSKNHTNYELFPFSLNFSFLTMDIYYFDNQETKITAVGRCFNTRSKFISSPPCIHITPTS